MEENNNDLFQKIGLDISHEKIHIDLAKTKSFFAALEEILKTKAETIQQDISEGKIDFAENVGIKVDDEHIDIDLGKTKSFIQELGEKVGTFITELDTAVSNISKK